MAALHGAFLPECLQPRAGDQGPRGEPYAQGCPCPGEPGRGRSEGASDRRRPARRQDEHGGRSGRAERVRDPDLLRVSRHSLAEIRTKILERIMKENSSTHPCRGHVPRWPVLPQPSGRAAALHRRHGMVSQVLHEHAASLSAASHANRGRRLTKCAKVGHYRIGGWFRRRRPTTDKGGLRPRRHQHRRTRQFAPSPLIAKTLSSLATIRVRRTGLHRNWLHGARQIPLSFHILVFKQLNCVRDH